MGKQSIPQEFGPQSSSDHSFARKCRLLQSWYRYNVLSIVECGIGPTASSTNRYGNMLIDGDKKGTNFLTPEIFEYANFRKLFQKKGETIDGYRLFNNMLGSQSMCFNLFVPLKRLFERDNLAANKLFKRCFPTLSIDRIIAAEIEYFPYPKEEYLDDMTAFDALIVYKDAENEKGLIAIETKYVESLGTNTSGNKTPQINLTRNCDLFTHEGIATAEVGYSQLGRNFLLGLQYAKYHGIKNVHEIVIAPEGNTSSLIEIQEFRRNLKTQYQDRVSFIPLEKFVESIKSDCPSNLQQWIRSFEQRYLQFSAISDYI